MNAHTTLLSESSDLPTSLLTGLHGLLARAWAFNWPLTLAGLLNLALIPIFLVAAILDPRVITGAPAWLKPLKFAISFAIYNFTFLWLLTFIQGRRRWVQFAAAATVIAFAVEIGLIAMQVVRGATSHFNIATPFDETVFNLMGAFVVLLALCNLLLGVLLLFQRLPDRALAWSLRLAVLISFVGMMTGVLMTTQETPAQRAADIPTASGAHSVGVEDGGPGLPLVGWSTEGGDLRVPHFAGLHALQVLPFIAWALARPGLRRRLDDRTRTLLVLIAGAGYLALTLILTWQALRGQSVVAPDGFTLAVLGGWLLVIAAATVAVLLQRPRTVARPARP
jgi:hypothetical protein